MEIYKHKVIKYCGSDRLNNTGGPHSRVRTETVSSTIFTIRRLKQKSETHCFAVPPDEMDIESFIMRLCNKIGFDTPDEASLKLKLPAEKLLVISKDPVADVITDDVKKIIRSGLILSKCSENYYIPDSPMIFTLNRLNRNVEIIKININNYYGLD